VTFSFQTLYLSVRLRDVVGRPLARASHSASHLVDVTAVRISALVC